jgi:hypothetical protein
VNPALTIYAWSLRAAAALAARLESERGALDLRTAAATAAAV